jgi:hypothetical protein
MGPRVEISDLKRPQAQALQADQDLVGWGEAEAGADLAQHAEKVGSIGRRRAHLGSVGATYPGGRRSAATRRCSWRFLGPP